MRFTTEHTTIVRSPDLFQDGTSRRVETQVGNRTLIQIMARLKGEDHLSLQSYHYPAAEAGQRNGWTMPEASRHSDDHGGSFQPASASRGVAMQRKRVTLKTAPIKSAPPVQVDREKGLITGVSVMEEGPAIGHGFDIDEQTLDTIVQLGNESEAGIKGRFTHPDMCHDGLGTELGRHHNFRKVAKQGERTRVLSDLQMINAAAHSPEGNIREWTLAMAEEDPGLIGLSVSMRGEEVQEEDEDGEAKRDSHGVPIPPVFRPSALKAVDVVDMPAANRRGLFGTAELSARATELLDAALAEHPQLQASGLSESDYQTLAGSKALVLLHEAPFFTVGKQSVSLSDEDGLVRAVTFIDRYLERRGIVHEAIDPAMLNRILQHPTRTQTMAPKDVTLTAVDKPADSPAKEPGVTAVVDEKTIAKAVATENTRVREIRALGKTFPGYDLEETLDACVEDTDCTLDRSKARVLERISQIQKDAPTMSMPGRVVVGETASQKFVAAAADCVMLRHGLLNGKDEVERAKQARATGLAVLRPQAMARKCLQLAGVPNIDMMPPDLLFAQVHPAVGTICLSDDQDPTMLQVVGHATGDFPLILANAGNKAMVLGYETAPTTWQLWTKKGDLNDFKTAKRLRLSEAPLLKERPEGMPAERGTLNEKGEDITLANFAEAFSYTRQMFVNDDLGAFLTLGRRFGFGASQTVERNLYENLTLNSKTGPTMSDSLVLFHATHANLNSGGAAAPSQTSLKEMVKAMMTQVGTGEDGAKLTIGGPPKFFLAEPGLASDIAAIIDAPFRQAPPGATATGGLEQPQWERLRAARAIEVPQLALQATTDWYGVANQDEAPSYEVAFLMGVDTPRTKTVVGTTVDGTEIVIDLDFAIFPTGGHEGINRNAGV